jgi:hypothetical protein
MLEEALKQFDLITILMVAVLTSFVVEAVNIYTPESISRKWIIFGVSLLITLIKLPFVPICSINDVQILLFTLLVNMSFAVLFYTYVGHWTVDKVFSTFKSKAELELNAKIKSDAGLDDIPEQFVEKKEENNKIN